MNNICRLLTSGKKWFDDSVSYISEHPLTSATVLFPATLFYVALVVVIKK